MKNTWLDFRVLADWIGLSAPRIGQKMASGSEFSSLAWEEEEGFLSEA